MKKNCYIKKLTSAEVGATKAHVGGYIRLPNDFDFTAFFQQKGQDNNGVIEIIFDAINCNNGKRERNLRFAYFKNSNQEKRIPNLATLFNENGVSAGDVIKLESCQNKGSVEFFIHFYKNSNIQTTATNVYYVYSDDGNETAIAISKNLPLQQIFYGAPGTGKSFKIKECTKGDDTVIRTTFHPDSDYSTFVGCYKPTTEATNLLSLQKLNALYPDFKKNAINRPLQRFITKYYNSFQVLTEKEAESVFETFETPATITAEVPKVMAAIEEIPTAQSISYSFVPQAFTKAYIRAWKKMDNYKPIDRVFYVGSTKYDIIGISGDLIRVKVSDSEDSAEIEIRKSELEDVSKTDNLREKEEQIHDKEEERNRNEIWGGNPNVVESDPGDIDKIKEGLGDRLKGIGKSLDDAWITLEKSFPKPQYLIIEEINRGNCAQIFGDLFQLLDRGDDGYSEYPIVADDDLREELEREFDKLNLDAVKYEINSIFKENYPKGITDKILSGELLVLPKNLYIWATMNTSDQSLFPIDSAFKRRWEWKYIKIAKGKDKDGNDLDWKIVVKDKDGNIVKINDKESLPWWDFISKINDIIASMTSSADKQLGYFFCKADSSGTITPETFVSKVIFYLWNDVFKDYGFEDAKLFQYNVTEGGKEITKDLSFPDFYNEEGEHVNTNRLKDFLENVMNY